MAITSTVILASNETGIASTELTPEPEHWQALLEAFTDQRLALPAIWAEIFGPLRQRSKDKPMVVGQIGQTIDGRIATVTGQSKYINGAAGLKHLHRLRALVDAVVVGVGTANAGTTPCPGSFLVTSRISSARPWVAPSSWDVKPGIRLVALSRAVVISSLRTARCTKTLA